MSKEIYHVENKDIVLCVCIILLITSLFLNHFLYDMLMRATESIEKLHKIK